MGGDVYGFMAALDKEFVIVSELRKMMEISLEIVIIND